MEFQRLLNHGTMNYIMNNPRSDFKFPILQILSLRKLTAKRKYDRYRLQISDGQYYNSLVLLSPNLNDMIYSGEITEFAIVMFRSYKFGTETLMEGKKNIMFITDLQVLRHGYVVGFQIGNPIPYPNNSVEDGSKTLNSATESNHSIIVKYEEILTKGSLISIMKNEEIENPVIQILKTTKIINFRHVQIFRCLISDGQNLSSFALLEKQLNGLIYSGELTEFAIVQIKQYLMCNIRGNPVIIITDADVLINGHRVGSIIGDPKIITDYSCTVDNDLLPFPVLLNNQFDYIVTLNEFDRFFFVEYEQMLTTGSIESITNNTIIESTLQVLKIEKIINYRNKVRYRLLLSDGHFTSSFFMLDYALNYIAAIFSEFSIIQITSHRIAMFKYSESEPRINIVIIKNLDILAFGNYVGLKIGDPKPISPENNIENYNDVLSKQFFLG